MRSGYRLARWAVGCVIVAGAAGAALALAGADTPARAPLVLVFLAAAPALAVASLLGGMDLLARAVVAGSAAIVINMLVAQAMILTGNWSPRTGVAAVALLSVLIALSRLVVSGSSVLAESGLAESGLAEPGPADSGQDRPASAGMTESPGSGPSGRQASRR